MRSKRQNFFLLEFFESEGTYFKLNNGPWTVQNGMLILENWCPNMTINNLRVERLDLWFKFSGLPFDLICPEVAWKAGELLGEPIMIDVWENGGVSIGGFRL